jgi:predicted nucleic acid-binding protein
MAFGAVLDANVLFHMPLCETLLRLAEIELFDPFWSDRILDEMSRNLVSNLGIGQDKSERRVQLMREAFDAAAVPAEAIEQLEPAMTNNEKDRHVLAAAVASGSQVVVTFNLRDFPDAACEPLGVETLHPDEFLMNLHDLDPVAVRAVVDLQAAELTTPPMTVDEVLDTLETVVPSFANAVRAQPASGSSPEGSRSRR